MPITKEQAEKVLKVFSDRHPMLSDKLMFQVFDSRSIPSHYHENFKGGYNSLPQKDRGGVDGYIKIVYDRIESENDLYQVLNHEVLGHYGLNTFAPDEKKLLLEAIIQQKDTDAFKPFWDENRPFYGDKNIYEQAEEIFARYMEDVYPVNYPENLQQAVKVGHEVLTQVLYKQKPLTHENLISITDMVSIGIRDNTRQQQTFFEEDITLQSRPEVRSVSLMPDGSEPEPDINDELVM